MTVFLAFVGLQYYPSRGVGDLAAVCATEGEAIAACEAKLKDCPPGTRPDDHWAQVVGISETGAAVLGEWWDGAWQDERWDS